MNYELAKQLKNAGFPLKKCVEPIDIYKVKDVGTFYYGADDYYFPTLSELIDACDSRLESILKLPNGKWETSSDVDYEIGETTGTTPEEAVAKLWLELKLHNRI